MSGDQVKRTSLDKFRLSLFQSLRHILMNLIYSEFFMSFTLKAQKSYSN